MPVQLCPEVVAQLLCLSIPICMGIEDSIIWNLGSDWTSNQLLQALSKGLLELNGVVSLVSLPGLPAP